MLLCLKIVSPEDNNSMYWLDRLKLLLESIVDRVTSSSSIFSTHTQNPVGLYTYMYFTLVLSYGKRAEAIPIAKHNQQCYIQL